MTLFDRMFGFSSRGSLGQMQSGTLDIMCALITGVGSMIGAVLELNRSIFAHRDILVLNSGGVITFGPSRPQFRSMRKISWQGQSFLSATGWY